MVPSRHDRKYADRDVKPQNKQTGLTDFDEVSEHISIVVDRAVPSSVLELVLALLDTHRGSPTDHV